MASIIICCASECNLDEPLSGKRAPHRSAFVVMPGSISYFIPMDMILATDCPSPSGGKGESEEPFPVIKCLVGKQWNESFFSWTTSITPEYCSSRPLPPRWVVGTGGGGMKSRKWQIDIHNPSIVLHSSAHPSSSSPNEPLCCIGKLIGIHSSPQGDRAERRVPERGL